VFFLNIAVSEFEGSKEDWGLI